MSTIHRKGGDLVRAWLGGDADALHRLVDLLRPALVGQAYDILRDLAAAEDVFIEVMGDLVGKLPTLREPDAVYVYARKAARTRAIDVRRGRGERGLRAAMHATEELRRKQNRDTEPVERLGRTTTPESTALRDERLEVIRELLAELGEPRASIFLAVADGEPIATAAERFGVSESTAHRMVRKCRTLLAARLAGFEVFELEAGGAA